MEEIGFPGIYLTRHKPRPDVGLVAIAFVGNYPTRPYGFPGVTTVCFGLFSGYTFPNQGVDVT